MANKLGFYIERTTVRFMREALAEAKLSCVAALATIDLLENGYVDMAAQSGAYLQERLREIAARHPHIGDVRGLGLMVAVELVKDKESKARAPELRDQVVDEAFQRGLLILGCGLNAIRLIPALNIPRDLLDEAIGILEDALFAVV